MEIGPDMQQALYFFFKFQEPLTAINGYKFSQMNREDKHKDIKMKIHYLLVIGLGVLVEIIALVGVEATNSSSLLDILHDRTM